MFRAILALQYSSLELVRRRPCLGHPCHQQPSMKQQIRAFVKTRSGRTGLISPTLTGRSTRYLRPLA